MFGVGAKNILYSAEISGKGKHYIWGVDKHKAVEWKGQSHPWKWANTVIPGAGI